MSTGTGDRLARGAAKATFQTAGPGVTDEQWDRIWAEDKVEPKPAEPSQKTGPVEPKPKPETPSAEMTSELRDLLFESD
jgi:hypothetical protein